ncbi:hypothetical protein, partial [Thermanaerothrix sp.]|uniref:hypothetical protein n=1 Tax=Thermanaerothrix sp. TaxID=2972675 RepID=UPI002ADE60FD
MWVLHAHWRPPKRQSDSGEVLFWAEDLAALTTSPATDHPAAAKAHPHPFGVAPEALRQRLGEGTPLAEAQPAAVVLHL